MESVCLGCAFLPDEAERFVRLLKMQWAGLQHLYLDGALLESTYQQVNVSQDCSELLARELVEAEWPLLQTLCFRDGSFTGQAVVRPVLPMAFER